MPATADFYPKHCAKAEERKGEGPGYAQPHSESKVSLDCTRVCLGMQSVKAWRLLQSIDYLVVEGLLEDQFPSLAPQNREGTQDFRRDLSSFSPWLCVVQGYIFTKIFLK